MTTIVAQLIVKPAKKAEFLDSAKKLVDGSRAETGNVSYHLYADMQNANGFTFLEVWCDQAAIDAHNQSAHFQQAVKEFGDELDGDMTIHLYSDTGL